MGFWSEDESEVFARIGRANGAGGEAIERTTLDSLPARRDEMFTCVAISAGWLSVAVLRHLLTRRVLGLDGSTRRGHSADSEKPVPLRRQETLRARRTTPETKPDLAAV